MKHKLCDVEENIEGSAKESELSFLLRPPVTKEEVAAAASRIYKTISSAYEIFESEGVEALFEHINKENKNVSKDHHNEGEDTSSEYDNKSVDEDAIIKGDPRRYQSELVEIAKRQNTIVQLNTGLGKTLIAIMMIRYFSSDYKTGGLNGELRKQTWFLVPSVALAVQQTKTLEVNLPFKVSTVCHTAGKSDSAREEFSAADILVMTHGSALELLQHYHDTFNFSRVNLIVVDECHHATKKHNYRHIFTQFYHTLDVLSRPRVLGLTATPIINVKINDTEEKLERMLKELEYTLDSTIVGLSSLGLPMEESGIIRNNMKELSIFYDQPPVPIENRFSDDHKNLHKSRVKELKQLNYLLQYGEAVLYRYCQALCKEISQNYYEKESVEQFAAMKAHLVRLTDYFENITLRTGGKSTKLLELEKLLHNLYGVGVGSKSNFRDTIGIVFVQRRISALSLKHYFSSKFIDLDGNNKKTIIRSGLLTRKITHVFKYLSSTQKMNEEEQEEARKTWLHTVQDTRKILNSLRSREINLLFATSVVEEGIDIDACSFVIVLDELQTIKTYVQMKGRARQLDANFYVFENTHGDSQKSPLSLSEANVIDSKVSSYLGLRKEIMVNDSQKLLQGISLEESTPDGFALNELSNILSSSEEEALTNQIYHSSNGMVDLLSSKSLVNRYCSCIPMDIQARSSRASMAPYLPVYKNTSLSLPSHLPLHVRNICLPPKFKTESKRENEKLLALIACVRLHKFGVLNHRLLPLKREDIQKKLCLTAIKCLKNSHVKTFSIIPPATNEQKVVYIYPLIQRGVIFDQNMGVLEGDRMLCIVSMSPLASASSFSLHLVHKSLRTVQCKLDSPQKRAINHSQWNLCTLFYTVLINARWRRRTGRNQFKFFEEGKAIFPPYLISCLNCDHLIDWDYMEVIINEYNRNDDERKLAVQNWSGSTPRLFAPQYDPNNTYIALQIHQNKNCSSPFPDKESEFSSFAEYFSKKWSRTVSDDCKLVDVQRCWDLPTKAVEVGGTTNMRIVEQISDKEASTTCRRLASVLLPQDLCLETPLADPSILLNCVMLPQILYQLERSETIHNFIEHCSQWRNLSECLGKIPFEDIMNAMTAKSCALEDISYDRLEYLGDAVLKLIHTDALINSKDEELRRWFHCLHEGDLTELRAVMGSNKRLKDVCKAVGFDLFILTKPLGRGTWEPSGLEKYVMDDVKGLLPIQDKCIFSPSTKTMADVVESIIGLIYEHCGYKAATKVALELDISTPRLTDSLHQMTLPEYKTIDQNLVKKAISFLGIENFKDSGFVIEACTHPSKTNSSNYQRLEWIGDAVLCLTAREWCYKHFPFFTVKNLVVIETILNCNETLSRIAFFSGLHRHILHCDPTLPGRLESYAYEIKEKQKGLWASDPPKVLADIVEALIGVAHIDGGFVQGQRAAKNAISSIIGAVEEHFTNSDQNGGQIMAIMHPLQAVTELCPVKIRSLTMNEYHRRFSSQVWFGERWDYCSGDGCYGNVGRITYFGLSLCEVACKNSRYVATIRSSSLFTSVLNKSKDLKSKIEKMTKALNQYTKAQSSPTAAGIV